MLVRFTSSTSGEMIMLAVHAHDLFEWMDKEGVAHGIFTKEQLPEAVARLRQGAEEEKQIMKRMAEEARAAEKESADETDEDKDEKQKMPREETVSLGQRAQPLIRLMEWTLKEKGEIVWEAARNF